MPIRSQGKAGWRGAVWAAALCLLPAVLPADVVHLKNGRRVEGDVTPGSRPGHLKVTLDKGLELEFPEKDVREVVAKKSPALEFDERLKALSEGDIDSLHLLAQWARERKLRSREEKVYRRILELDPNDPVARRELGYVVFRNRWVKENELKTKHGLIQFRGDWVSAEEKDRRIREELSKEVTELLRGVDSDNRYIREYSIQKLMEYRDPRVRSVILGFLGDPREVVRVVAAQVLAALMPAPDGPARGTSSSAGRKTESRKDAVMPKGATAFDEEVARALLERTLREESPTVRTSLAAALQKMRPRRFFELALDTLSTSGNPLHRDRAAEGVFFALERGWMDELIRALPRRPPGLERAVGGSPEVRSILTRIAREDFEYRVADWQAWWARNQHRFQNEG